MRNDLKVIILVGPPGSGKSTWCKNFLSKHSDYCDAGWTPLMYAALFNRKAIGRLLISKGAEINAKSSKGETALSIALEEGQTEFVELLKKAGAR